MYEAIIPSVLATPLFRALMSHKITDIVLITVCEPQREKTYLLSVSQTKTQISLRIRTICSVFTVRMKKLYILCYPKIRPVKILIRLRECAVWSESSLGAHVVKTVFSRCKTFVVLTGSRCFKVLRWIIYCHCWLLGAAEQPSVTPSFLKAQVNDSTRDSAISTMGLLRSAMTQVSLLSN